MLQLDFLEAMLKACREKGIHTAVDTAGAVPFDSFERILPYTDMFLYDVKSMDPQIHRQYTGVSNERILDNLSRLLRMKKRTWIRVPVIPGVNDTLEEMQKLRAFLLENGYPEQVELLPYHRLGEGKCQAMGHEAVKFDIPSKEWMDELREAVKPSL